MADGYRRFRITSRGAVERERLLAEAFEAGAEGAEESEADGLYHAIIYAPHASIASIREVMKTSRESGTVIDPAEALPDVDWSEAWKEGIEALEISSRLVVRPPFVDHALAPGQKEIVIDPGQAFGTGGHASTRLCLEWIDALYADPGRGVGLDRVLDAGTGSGVLAFAALVLGARSAIGFDLDEVAIEAARSAARENGLADRVELVACGIDELPERATGYPLVVANLLKREVLPIASSLVARLAEEGRLVLSGLLEEDAVEVLDRFRSEGLVETQERRTIVDGVGAWIGLCLSRE